MLTKNLTLKTLPRAFSVIFILLTGFFAACIFAFATLKYNFDDEDYRRQLINLVDQYSDYQLKISGSFQFNLSTTSIELSASDIEFHSKTSHNLIKLNKFDAQWMLPPLLDGILQIKQLNISDMTILLVDSDDKDSSFNFEPHYFLPAPVIMSASISNVVVRNDAGNKSFILNQLKIDDINNQGPLFIDASGSINQQAFSANGQLGALKNLLTEQPYSVDIKFQTQYLIASLQGQIKDVLNAEGLELDLNIVADDLSNIKVLSIPKSTRLTFNTKLVGELYQPELTDLDLHLSRGDKAKISATGGIKNIFSLNGIDITLTGFFKDPEITTLLFSDSMPQFDDITFDAKIIDQHELVRFDDINVMLSNSQGLTTTLSGNIDINPSANTIIQSSNIIATIDATTTTAARPFLIGQLPEMGPVNGKAIINSHNMNMAIEDIDIVIGKQQNVTLFIKGRIGKLPLDPDGSTSEISLDLAAKAKSTQAINDLLELNLPEIGPVTITSLFNRQTTTNNFDNIQLTAGNPETLLVKASGHLKLPDHNKDTTSITSQFNIEVNALSSSKASQQLGFDLPELGPIKATMIVKSNGDDISANEIDIQLGQKQQLLTKLTGNVGSITLANKAMTDINLKASIHASSTHALSVVNKKLSIPDFGPINGQFNINGSSKSIQIREIEINAGKKDKLTASLRGTINQFQPTEMLFQGTDIAITANAPTSHLITDRLGIKTNNLGSIKLTAQISNSKEKQLQLNKIYLTVGKQNHPALVASGSINDLLHGSKISINASFNEQLIYPLLSVSPKEPIPVKANISISDHDGSLGIESLSLETPQQNILNAKIQGSIDDIINEDGISVDMDISVKDLANLNQIFDLDLPSIGPVKFLGKLQGTNEKASFDGKFNIRNTEVNTQFTLLHIHKNELKPLITGLINIPVLHLQDIGLKQQTPSPQQPDSTTKLTDTFLFSQTPMSFDWFDYLDMDIKLDIDQVEGTEFTLDTIDMNILLKDNTLKLDSAKLIYADGQIKADASIEAQNTPQFTLKLLGDNINITGIMAQSLLPSPIEGELNLFLDLSGKGRSAHQIASSLNGEIGITLEQGKIRKRQIDALFLDIIDWLFTFGMTQDTTIMDCAMARYNIKQGTLSTELFYLDGPKLSVRGKGKVDLKTETIDAVFNLEKKRVFMNSQSPIHISGKLSSPKVLPMPHKQGILKIGTYFFAPFIGIPFDTLGSIGELLFKPGDKSSCQERVLMH